MASENVERLRRLAARSNIGLFAQLVDAINREDIEALVRLTAEDVVLIPRRAATEGAYVGHDGVRSLFADTQAAFEVFRLEYPDVRDLGDRILAIGTVHVRGRGSHVETVGPSAGITTFREGKATRFEDFGDESRALEAAGPAVP